ncbi:hypothetical protein U1Q18_039927 [Sarracenia purpurea var. burkii]
MYRSHKIQKTQKNLKSLFVWFEAGIIGDHRWLDLCSKATNQRSAATRSIAKGCEHRRVSESPSLFVVVPVADRLPKFGLEEREWVTRTSGTRIPSITALDRVLAESVETHMG